MSYLGSTQASSIANPPTRISQGPLSNAFGGALWKYDSTDPSTDIATAGYFTDGLSLGMQAGDLVVGVTATAGTSSAAPRIAYAMPITYSGSTGAGASGSRMTSTMA